VAFWLHNHELVMGLVALTFAWFAGTIWHAGGLVDLADTSEVLKKWLVPAPIVLIVVSLVLDRVL
jgi:hypothetical protein